MLRNRSKWRVPEMAFRLNKIGQKQAETRVFHANCAGTATFYTTDVHPNHDF